MDSLLRKLVVSFVDALIFEASTISKNAERDVEIYVAVLGLSGLKAISQSRASSVFSISRKSVRNICTNFGAKIIPNIASKREYQGLYISLEETIKSLQALGPVVLSDIIKNESVNFPLNTRSEDILALIRFAALIGIYPQIKISEWGNQYSIHESVHFSCCSSMLSLSKKMIANFGGVSSQALQNEFAKKEKIVVPIVIVDAILRLNATWVCDTSNEDEALSWYYYPKKMNRVIDRITKRISSLGHCPLESIGSINCPALVMQKILSACGFIISTSRITLSSVAQKHVLPPIQLKMVKILMSMADKKTKRIKIGIFIKKCSLEGIKKTTARKYVYKLELFNCSGGYCSLS